MAVKPLSADQVRRRVDPKGFRFASTAELRDVAHMLGQERAMQALDFGIGMRREDYNLFVMGASGSGRHSAVRRHLRRQAAEEAQPDDWAYVYNFDLPHKPQALRLPPGRAAGLRDDMVRLVEEISAAIPAAFETDAYRNRREAIESQFKERQEKAFGAIGEEARKRGLALIRTPAGLALAPVRNEEVLPPEEYRKLPEPVRQQIERDIEELQQRLQQTVQQVPDWDRERRRETRELNRETSNAAVTRLLKSLKARYAGLDAVPAYLDRVEKDIVDNAGQFLRGDEAQHPEQGMAALLGGGRPAAGGGNFARRYEVNVVVGDGAGGGAPVVEEESPAYNNLIGRVEQMAEMGALVTDFTLIKPGSLHAANGGYLVIDALRLLQQPWAWEGLKRALRTRAIRIESPGQMMSTITTVSLEPEPIPLDVKVVLIGDRQVYYLLCQNDPDFARQFKVSVDFEDDMVRSARSHRQFAALMATLVRENDLRHLAPDGVARVLEHAVRLSGDVDKLTLQIGRVADLLKEADFFAARGGRWLVRADDVQAAIDAQQDRADRVPRRMQESIINDTVLIDTDGAQVGQINGLAVFSLGNTAFGKPSRITARVRVGTGEVVDIERRAELGGSLHTKGVMILSAYLGARYATDLPLSLSASLVFEQSYGGVDGDSASSAELYALLSALSRLPIGQGFAVTGSVNQHGVVQAIGGVNEKVEGFYDICAARGLTGDQGVLIPKANVRHLMLRPDVAEAIRKKQFHVYAIASIDEGIALLTGRPAGRPGRNGRYPANSVNRLVQDRIVALADERRRFARSGGRDGGSRNSKADGDAEARS